MAYIPPVRIPSFQTGGYGAQLNQMISGMGDPFVHNRDERTRQDEWQQNYARGLANDARSQANEDRRYALDLQRLEQNGAGGTEYYGSAQWYEMDDGTMGFGVIGKDGSFKDMSPPAGSKWAPRVTYQDTGTARVPTNVQGGSVSGPSLPVHGSPEPGTVQTNPGALPGGPGGGVPGLPGGGVPTYEPVGPKAVREQQNNERDLRKEQTQGRQRLSAVEAQAGTVIQQIDDILRLADGGWATGTTGALMEGPGLLFPTSRGELTNALRTVLSNVSFDKLQQMREMSPTGGALGQVSDFENRLLQATKGPLDPMQPEQMRQTLENIRASYVQATVAYRIAYMTDFEGLDRASADNAIDAIRQGADPNAVLAKIQGGR